MVDSYEPTYRFRGHVKPSAEVARPAAAYRNASAAGGASSAQASSSATLDIFDVIDSYGGYWGISSKDVDAALKSIGDVETLYVRLNSPGGEATEGVAIANLLRAHPANVRVTVYGLAASAASMIAMSGDVVSMGPGTLMMVHDAWNFECGDAAEMRKAADTLDAISDSTAALYALKAGGTAASWRAVMRESVWYSADAAVAAKLADVVGLDPQMPDNLPDVETDEDTEDAEATVIQIDVEISPAARAAARRFDLSLLPAASAAKPKTPATKPVAPSTQPKEADVMSDTLLDALRKQHGLADDADEATVLAANADALTEAADPPSVTTDTAVAALASANGIDTDTVKAAVAAAKAGKVTVSQSYLDAIEANAKLGAEARKEQVDKARDEAIQAKVSAGIISRDQVESWQRDWDRDPASAKAELDKLTVARFPVAPLEGYAGGESASASTYTDDMASEDAAFFGLPKEALTR